jgi:hypothetical protein
MHIEKRYARRMSDPTTRPLARPRLIRLLAGGILLSGWLWAVIGVAYAVNGATQAGGYVVVPVRAEPPENRHWVTADATLLSLPDSNLLRAEDQRWELMSWDSTVVEQLLTRADEALVGLAVLAGAMLLSPLLRSIAAGRPFQPSNARRIAAIAVLVAVIGTIAPQLPRLATHLVLNRIDMVGADWLVSATEPFFALDPLLIAALLLVTAECFRHGAELADEVAGLV